MTAPLKILVASPDDVKEERETVYRVIMRLRGDPAVSAKVDLIPVLWEHQPQHAGETFQKQISHPAEAQIVIVIFWSKFGSPLPNVPEFRGPDGKSRTGTEYEFETAIQSWRQTGAPTVWVYRSKREVILRPGPGGELDRDKQQFEALEAFWQRRIKMENRAHKWFDSSQELESTLEADLRVFIDERTRWLEKFADARAELDHRAKSWKERNYSRDLLLRSGQLLRDAAEIQKTFRNQLDSDTNAFISDSMHAQSRKTIARIGVLCAFALLALAIVFYFWHDAEAAKQQAVTEQKKVEAARDAERKAKNDALDKHEFAADLLLEMTGDLFEPMQRRFWKLSPNELAEKYQKVLKYLNTSEEECVKTLQGAGPDVVRREMGGWMVVSVLNDTKATEPLNRLRSLRLETSKKPDLALRKELVQHAETLLKRQYQIDKLLAEKTNDEVFYGHLAYDLSRLINLELSADRKETELYLLELSDLTHSAIAKNPTSLRIHRDLMAMYDRIAKDLHNHGEFAPAIAAGKQRVQIGVTFFGNNIESDKGTSADARTKLDRDLCAAYVDIGWKALIVGDFAEAARLSKDGRRRYQAFRDTKSEMSEDHKYFHIQYYQISTTLAAAHVLLREFDDGRMIYEDNAAHTGFREQALREIKVLHEINNVSIRKALMNQETLEVFRDIQRTLESYKPR